MVEAEGTVGDVKGCVSPGEFESCDNGGDAVNEGGSMTVGSALRQEITCGPGTRKGAR